ncbi:collagen binding domain-containing protein [Gordonia polyisoprenivorans]|uniref:MSCRAMM family protein n=1 Tax=Gordonia polyisoprenivorans TaxID=84595 RepID=UPI000367305C|nr:carboxypeptidase regulatory-like domain-containing protein [Gordonia polyisoprenivorans]
MEPAINGHGGSGLNNSGRGDSVVGLIQGVVHRPDGGPIADATVTVIDPGGSQAARTIAGADGTFGVRVAGAGHYVLAVSAAGHEPAAVTVTVGTAPVDTEIILASMGTLAGIVTTSATGEPVARATIAIADRTGQVVATTVTDGAGHWQIGGLGDDTLTVIVTAAGCDPVAETVHLADGEITTVLRTATELTGVITDGTTGAGTPVGHSQVALLNDAGEMAASTLTDEVGRYLFANLTPGDYTVVANGYAPVAATIDVAAGRVANHEFVLGARGQA